MTQYSPRPTTVYEVPLPKGTRILRPETVILDFSHGHYQDVGSLCYLRRKVAGENQKGHKHLEGRHVDPDSLDVGRKEQVRQLIALVSDLIAEGVWRPRTAHTNLGDFLKFFTWADSNGHTNLLAGEQEARAGVCAYLNDLRDRVNRNELSVNTAAQYQDNAFDILGKLLGTDRLTTGLNLLRKSKKAVEPTEPPDEMAVAKLLALCEALFNAFSKLVLENKPFPYWVAMPHYLGLPQNGLWAFPATSWCMPPHVLAERDRMKVPRWAYDYSNGRLATLAELQALHAYESEDLAPGQKDKLRVITLNNADKQLKQANAEPQHVRRREAAVRAHHAFLTIFMALSGLNSAQVVELPWEDDEYEVISSRQQFRAIKYRARGREVIFELPVSVMPAFKCYLKLRRWLLNGHRCPFLFFMLGSKATGKPQRIKDVSLYAFRWYETLRYIDPALTPISARQWRAAKSDWLIRFKDLSTAALVLQNSERTLTRSYAAGSQATHLAEMSEFLDKVSAKVISTVLAKGEAVDGSVSRAAGNCVAYGEPVKIADTAAVQPDCKRPEGCLFCDKFRVHADERDTRKLVSCRYCIQQVASLVGSEELFQLLLAPILERVQEILAEIDRRTPDLVPRVVREVEEDGELDPYWESKLQMLMDLGWVA